MTGSDSPRSLRGNNNSTQKKQKEKHNLPPVEILNTIFLQDFIGTYKTIL